MESTLQDEKERNKIGKCKERKTTKPLNSADFNGLYSWTLTEPLSFYVFIYVSCAHIVVACQQETPNKCPSNLVVGMREFFGLTACVSTTSGLETSG